ncbi:MAG TPA: hypothetical protein H9756_09120 [Candidatus Mediterraneibacter gallistercoris]|uniref:Uncharacterized protein n=1 Tax=Candidatus Mediterraneibacter gallistercoris TaxID=2838671 RepID=A0A9D2P6M2_9FIRM|nr:hypothetical protein [Candidatus Mediterraneibacter gallistercoris]
MAEDKESNKDTSISGEPEDTEELSEAEIYKRGYDLPIDSAEKEEAEQDCAEMMEAIRDIYEKADKGTSINAVISQETAIKMQQIIAEKDVPAAVSGFDVDMMHYDAMEDFLDEASAGNQSEIILYRIHTDGTVSREKFTFDGKDMYSLYTKGRWTDDMEPAFSVNSRSRMSQWKYTEKGWFIFEYCTAQPPELTEVVDAYEMIRVKPQKEEYREMEENYLDIIGYQGNNLLCSEWSEDQIEGLDFNGLYEYLYMEEYGREIDTEKCAEGIPREEFESLMTKYLPVTAEQLREYASYDAESGTYDWVMLGVGNYAPNAFWISVPEVTGIRENEDGTVTLTVDVVCEKKGNDDFYTHEVTLRILDDGKAMYLSNHIMDDRPGMIPDYQYRCR